MFDKSWFGRLTALAALLLLVGAADAVTIETVPVGNPGNDPDTEVMTDSTTGYGSVAYAYRIGKYEVTAGQYTEFLNAVAATDAYDLYNILMSASEFGCQIERSGNDGNYHYEVAPDWANRPANFVSWGDAARFANWLHNGQSTGAQDPTTTEDGAYFLDGATTDEELFTVTRESDWTWAIPTEDEWYKAAYYDPGKPGGAGYWDYPTQSDDPNVPSNDLVEPTDSGNNATFYVDGGDDTTGSPYWRTEVGAHENSDSAYGTFDQGGNVWEWNEATRYEVFFHRGQRGGCVDCPDYSLRASGRSSFHLTDEYDVFGFRVVGNPEALPGDMNGDREVDHQDVALFLDHVLDGPYHVAADMNEDGVLNGRDCAPFVAAVQGSASTQPVPEPATFWLTAIGLLCVLWRRRRVA